MTCGEHVKAAKTEHTPEPWFSQYDDNGFYEIGSESVSLRLAFTYGEGDTDEANARRIVACVNACAGIETDHLEKYGLPDFAQKISDLREQRDELLANAEESDAVRDRLAKLLSETAIALKGEEEALQRHSWHDLPVVALAAMLEITILKQQRDELLSALRGLVASCDTGERGPDGRQHGTRMPDRCFVQAGHDAIARVKGGAA